MLTGLTLGSSLLVCIRKRLANELTCTTRTSMIMWSSNWVYTGSLQIVERRRVWIVTIKSPSAILLVRSHSSPRSFLETSFDSLISFPRLLRTSLTVRRRRRLHFDIHIEPCGVTHIFISLHVAIRIHMVLHPGIWTSLHTVIHMVRLALLPVGLMF